MVASAMASAPSTVLGITSDRMLTIQVDPAALAKAKGGAAASFINTLAPDTIATQVYSEMKNKIVEALQKEGVNAVVQVVPSTGANPIKPSTQLRDLGIGAIIGVGTAGLGYGLVKLVRSMFNK